MISKDDLKSLIKRIKDRTGLGQEEISVGAGYKRTSLTEILSKGDSLDAAYRQLQLIYGDKLIKSTPEEKEGSAQNKDGFSSEQLFAMFLEVSKAQTKILTSIESKMAQEKTQAMIADKIKDIDANLIRTLTGVEVLSGDSEASLKMIREISAKLKEQKNVPSGGAGKRSGQTDGVGAGHGKKR